MTSIDLILVQNSDGTRTMTGFFAKDGEEARMVGPFPAKGAIGPIADAMFALEPDRWKSLSDCQAELTIIHFRNMGTGENSAGQSYPYSLGT